MTVIGIDPGIERLGYAVLEFAGSEITPVSYGLITTKKETPKNERLLQIYDDLKSLIEKHKPERMSVETLLFAKNVKTALVVSEVRGVILLLSALFNLPLYEFTPLQVKSGMTGYGRSSKGQIQKAVKMVLKLAETPKPDDVSDAIAIALCACQKKHF
jgi:crossover junction endodeoxyribonuclease RuvC